MFRTPFEDYDEVSAEAVSQVLPTAMMDGLRTIQAHIEAAFPDVDAVDRSLCVTITLATWVYELDKAGRLDMRPADVAFIYQAGRIAAQEVKPPLLPRLQSTIEALQFA